MVNKLLSLDTTTPVTCTSTLYSACRSDDEISAAAHANTNILSANGTHWLSISPLLCKQCPF